VPEHYFIEVAGAIRRAENHKAITPLVTADLNLARSPGLRVPTITPK
jgi:hypothetical protein